MYYVGLDIGSTTIKVAVLDQDKQLVYERYRRHLSDVRKTPFALLTDLANDFAEESLAVTVTGSGGISAAQLMELPFLQEVVAGLKAIRQFIPETDVAIELGGEDAKITYLGNDAEQRMNGTCAGGTGAFLDQMAALLDTDCSGLDTLAADAKTIYPIASRCGVFAKSDIQPLLNEGAAKSDIACSIFQSVVDQTITGLACGKPIRGKVAFLGGPLYFLPRLRERFVETLHLTPEQTIVPEHAQLFVAIGAACHSFTIPSVKAEELRQRLGRLLQGENNEIQLLPPLFANEDELAKFRQRHSQTRLATAPLAEASGPCFLGMDSGSTTSKAVVIDADGRILYEHYNSNHGSPLDCGQSILQEIYGQLPANAYIARACVTGYGENMLKAAFHFDEGEIETIAHYWAARFLQPKVDFILDIGGQDMKCMQIRNGGLSNILLNEACSSGCGSFIETFARALGLSAAEFGEKALLATSPVDLGSRCTVFMNSRVKQAQKEGANVGDISAGLSYSVVKNALFKVIKLRNAEDMGKYIVVQGGTFLNEAVLRAFELTCGREVIRPDKAGLMGAFGAALLAKEHWAGKGQKSSLVDVEYLDSFFVERSTARCQGCGNHCLLSINRFPDGSRHISNNRCEKGQELGKPRSTEKVPDLYAFKYDRMDQLVSLTPEEAPRGVIGIPRVLNMYENYSFWHTFWTALGYSVQLSPRSSRSIYELGAETMPSESVCYPAKLTHGHIMALLQQGIHTIFYPCLPYEQDEKRGGDNHYNCPVVGTYPEVLRNNMPQLQDPSIRFISCFLPYDDMSRLAKRLTEELADMGITAAEIRSALALAKQADNQYKAEVRAQGEAALAWVHADPSRRGIVLAGRPYHIDPEINHGIPSMITGYGCAVLSEDSIAHLHHLERPINMVDQWTYHSRLYQAADVVRRDKALELVQLNSFGCGLDALTTDMVQQLMTEAGRLYTCLKIDEVHNLGAARIRIRSLLAAMASGAGGKKEIPHPAPRRRFSKQMKKEGWTILAPQMSPLHFAILEEAFCLSGYRFRVLDSRTPDVVELGLKYVNNDACYPAILTIGQLAKALLSGEYDLNHTALAISQTGGGCRATNYISMLRRMMDTAGFSQVPIISINNKGMEKSPGFSFTPLMILRAMMAVVYGDALQRLVCRVRPYELEPGAADAMVERWTERCRKALRHPGWLAYRRNLRDMVNDFASIPVVEEERLKVGLVGEILVKYHPMANNDAIRLVEAEGGEAVVPELMGFLQYSLMDGVIKHRLLSGSKKDAINARLCLFALDVLQRPLLRALRGSKFGMPHDIRTVATNAQEIASLGNICGEGWLLSGEMISLIHEGVDHIVCMQPFACLPNHVVGKGMIRAIKRKYPDSSIIPVDYDPGTSPVNQLNRIRLMMTMAKEK